MKWVVDTNVLSELPRPSPNRAVVRWFQSTPAETLFVTSVTLAEIRGGIRLQADVARAKVIEDWLEGVVRPAFLERTLEADEDALVTWRLLSRQAQKRGRPAPPVDLLIAAIAVNADAAVVTRDAASFALAGVPVYNPWTDERFNPG